MRSSFKPEEVDRIEMKAYEVGISVGEFQERERIIAILESISFLEDYPPFNNTIIVEEAIALIKGEVGE